VVDFEGDGATRDGAQRSADGLSAAHHLQPQLLPLVRLQRDAFPAEALVA
jgi:hypothetical protein